MGSTSAAHSNTGVLNGKGKAAMPQRRGLGIFVETPANGSQPRRGGIFPNHPPADAAPTGLKSVWRFHSTQMPARRAWLEPNPERIKSSSPALPVRAAPASNGYGGGSIQIKSIL